LPVHVTRAISPSPARATPHDATAWLPVPDPRALPSLAELLDAATLQLHRGDAREGNGTIDLASLEALVTPTPARAEPHDAAAWFPLPADLDQLPDLPSLLEPPPEVTVAVVAEAEAVVAEASAAAEAAVAPSPARADPHDSSTWLPLPDPDALVPLSSLATDGAAGAERRGAGRRLAVGVRRPRTWGFVLLTVATVAGVARVTADPSPPAVAKTAPIHVSVDVDGVQSVVTTSARDPQTLGRQLRLGRLVAVRTGPTHLAEGSSVVFRTRKSGLLDVDGQLVPYDSPSLTVGELLASSRIVLDGQDTTLPPPDAVLVDGTRVQVVRVGAATMQTQEAVPFADEQIPDPTIPIGQTREIRAGVPGVDTVTWRAQVVNGLEVGRTELSRVTTTAPVSHQVGYGTMADWHWDALANCETGGKWNTIDPAGAQGYHGGLGIYQPNWVYYGGLAFAPNAGLATREQQIIIGQRIYDDHGWYAWGCARNTLGWPPR
jgi:hypothetical protein